LPAQGIESSAGVEGCPEIVADVDRTGDALAAAHAPVVVRPADRRPATVRRHTGCLEVRVSQVVDYENVSAVGLESSPFAEALAGLRANEARYYGNKYGHVFAVDPASEAPEAVEWVHRILREERDIIISARPLEATTFEVDGLRMAYVFYESGLAINVMYGLAAGGKRAVGFKLSEGMEVPEELASRFKFARQKSKLAGTIRGSFFVIKGEY
jgi:hypothetical protein